MVDTEISEQTSNRNVCFNDISDFSHHRASGKIVFEFSHSLPVTFGDDLDAAIGKVFHCAQNLMPRGCAEHKKPVTDSLDKAGDEKSSRDHIINDLSSVKLPLQG